MFHKIPLILYLSFLVKLAARAKILSYQPTLILSLVSNEFSQGYEPNKTDNNFDTFHKEKYYYGRTQLF
jgi:hypothetical protein